MVARVNGVDIRQSDLAFAEEEIGGNMPQMPPAQKRDYLITYLADVIVCWRRPPSSRSWATATTSSTASPSSATRC